MAAEGLLDRCPGADDFGNVWSDRRPGGRREPRRPQEEKTVRERRAKPGRGGPVKAVVAGTDKPTSKDLTPTRREPVRRTSSNGAVAPGPFLSTTCFRLQPDLDRHCLADQFAPPRIRGSSERPGGPGGCSKGYDGDGPELATTVVLDHQAVQGTPPPADLYGVHPLRDIGSRRGKRPAEGCLLLRKCLRAERIRTSPRVRGLASKPRLSGLHAAWA